MLACAQFTFLVACSREMAIGVHPTFLVVVIFARFFCRQFTNLPATLMSGPDQRTLTSVVTLLGPQGWGGTFPLAYKGWYAFTPLGRGAFLSRHEEEPCSVVITIRICER